MPEQVAPTEKELSEAPAVKAAMETETNPTDDSGAVPDKQPYPKYDPGVLPDMLPLYYKRLFPHKPFYRWLSYGGGDLFVFRNREISFTLHDDIYLRYLSFDNQSELEKEICTRNPYKIDIGAVMQASPKNFRRANTAMLPVQRELVFDIDMTDYDDVRTCCEGASVCLKCWKFMGVAARILDAALREDLGFEHILWVFSGRRGIHCWVCDHEARTLDTRRRTAVAEYLQIIKHVMVGGGNVARVQISGDRMHHSVRRALNIVAPLFDEVIIEDQNVFGTPKGVQRLLNMIADDAMRKSVEAHLAKSLSDGAHSREVWTAFERYTTSMRTGGSLAGRKLKHIVEEIQLSMLYPRLDINVTKGFNHLLKAPFCIHPGTGKVCVPFNASAAGKFDPTTVPTIAQLLQEINAFDDKSKAANADEEEEAAAKRRIKDYKKTSMFKGVVVFEEFLRKLESSNLKAAKKEMDF